MNTILSFFSRAALNLLLSPKIILGPLCFGSDSRILLVRTAVEDLSPLVNNQFLGEKTTIYLSGSYENSRLVGEVLEKYLDDIETLRSRGITVSAPF